MEKRSDNLIEFIKGIKLLVCEDDNFSREFLVHILNSYVDRVFSAENGEVGLEIFKKEFELEDKIDIVITDVNMPKLNGFDMGREIKKLSSKTPIVIVSAFDDIDNLKEALDIGVDRFILKPVDAKNLIATILKLGNYIYQDELLKNEFEYRIKEGIIRSKSEILEDISHHWRNPLNAISLLSQSISQKLDDESVEEYHQRVSSATKKIEDVSMELSRVITNFSSLGNDRGSISMINIKKSIEELVVNIFGDEELESNESNKRVIIDRQRGLKVVVDIVDDLKIEGVLSEFLIVVYNIIKNAIDALKNRDDGVIEIAGFRSEDKSVLKISNNGDGIKDEILKRVFEPYFSTKSVSSGRGLGLFVVKKIANEHFCADVSIKSRSDGVDIFLTF